MNDTSKTKSQLLLEIDLLRQRVADLEKSVAQEAHTEQDFNQTIIDTSPAYLVILDAQGNIKMMSKSMLAALGYSQEEVLGKNYLSTFVPEREREELSAIYEQQLFRGKATLNQSYILARDGRELLVEWQGHPLLNQNDEMELFYGTGLDITERAQAEDALLESERRFRSLYEATFEGIAITDKGIVIDANERIAEMLGYSHDEILGMRVMDMVAPESRDLVQERISSGYESPYEHLAIRRDKSTFFVEARGKAMPYEGRVVRVTSIRDVTERKQTEEAYHALVESSLQALVILQDGRIIFANPAAEVLAGYSVEELLDMENPIQTLIHPEDLPSILERVSQRTAGEVIPPLAIYRILRKNGQIRWVESYTQQIELKGRPADHTVYIDITERKLAEDELQRISHDENKRRKELEKLREISASMREAERSGELLQVFTREVQEFSHAEVTESIVFKAPKQPVIWFAPEAGELNQEQLGALKGALLNAKKNELLAEIPDFKSVLVLPLQSSDTVHGAVLVASRVRDAFTPDEQNMLNAIADMAGTALHRIDILETLEERVQRRTHDLVVLYNLITIISENWRLQDILELSLVLTLETVKADRGIIYLTDGKEPPGLKPVIQRGFADGFSVEAGSLPDDELARGVFGKHKLVALNNLAEFPAYTKFGGVNSYAGIPITVRGDMRGVFSLFANEKNVFGADEMALLTSIADHLGIGIENSILWEQSRENAAIEERNRLARNLHDSVTQLLYSLTLMTGSTKKMLERDPELEAVKKSVARLGDTAHQALKEMRLLLYELRPAVLESEGLVNALQYRVETVEERLGVKVDLQANGLPELPSMVEDALYHIALEALNNIVKHAECTSASIRITSENDAIVMEVSDSGKGFDESQPHKGQGLRNMHERAQILGGEFLVDSQPGNGTNVTVRVKIPTSSLIES